MNLRTVLPLLAASVAGAAPSLLDDVLSPLLHAQEARADGTIELLSQRTKLNAEGGFHTALHRFHVNSSAMMLRDILDMAGAARVECEQLGNTGEWSLSIYSQSFAPSVHHAMDEFARYHAYLSSLGPHREGYATLLQGVSVDSWLRDHLAGSMLVVGRSHADAVSLGERCHDMLVEASSLHGTGLPAVATSRIVAAHEAHEDEKARRVKEAQLAVPAVHPLEVAEVSISRSGDSTHAMHPVVIHMRLHRASTEARLVMPIVSVRHISAPSPASAASLWWTRNTTASSTAAGSTTRQGVHLQPSAAFNAVIAKLGSKDHNEAVSTRLALLNGEQDLNGLRSVSAAASSFVPVLHFVESEVPLSAPIFQLRDTLDFGSTTTTNPNPTPASAPSDDYFIHNFTDSWNPFSLNYDPSTGGAAAEINFGDPSAICTNCFAEMTLGYELDMDFCHDIVTLSPKCPPNGDRFTCMYFIFAIDGSIGMTVNAQASNVQPGVNDQLFYPSTYVSFSGISIPLFEPLVLQIAPSFGLGGAVQSDNGMPGTAAWGFDVSTNNAQLGFRYDYINGFQTVKTWNPTINVNLDPSFKGLSPQAATTAFSLIPQINFTLTFSADGVVGVGAPLVINPYVNAEVVVSPDSVASLSQPLNPLPHLRAPQGRSTQGCASSDSTYQVEYGCDMSFAIGSLAFSVAGYSFDLWDGTTLGRTSIFGPDPLNCATCTGCVSNT